MLDEKAKALFNTQKTWFIATCSEDDLNVVPIGLTAVLDDGRMALGDVDMNKTAAHIHANGRAAIAACAADPISGYQVKGKAEYIASGPIVAACQEMADAAFGGKVKVKGVVVVTPEECISLTS